MKKENYNLIVYFISKPMTVREYIEFSKDVLMKLKDVDPIFENLFGWGKKANARKQISPDMHDFEQIVFEQIKDNSIAYQNPDLKNREFTWDSKSFVGYSNSYSNTTRIRDGKISIKITCGQENSLGILMIKFPQYNYIQFENGDFVKTLFVKCINLTNPIYGCIVSDEFSNIVKRDQDKIWIGWFNYISNKDVLNILPENIYKEYMHNGTLFYLKKSMPEVSDVSLINKALEVRNELRKRKIL